MKIQRKEVLTALASAVAMLVVLVVSPVSRADTAAEKAGRGLAAITTPFLEIPGNIYQTTERDGPVAGWTMGLAKGLGMSIVRPHVGLYELITAPIPAPEDFEPILQPEYPWSYFGVGDDSDFAQK